MPAEQVCCWQAWRAFVAPAKRTGADAHRQLAPLREALHPLICTCDAHPQPLLSFPPPGVVCKCAISDVVSQTADAHHSCWSTIACAQRELRWPYLMPARLPCNRSCVCNCARCCCCCIALLPALHHKPRWHVHTTMSWHAGAGAGRRTIRTAPGRCAQRPTSRAWLPCTTSWTASEPFFVHSCSWPA